MEQPEIKRETVLLRVELALVGTWSNVVEKIAWAHGTNVRLSPSDDGVIYEVDVLPEVKPKLMAELQRYWEQFRLWKRGRGESA